MAEEVWRGLIGIDFESTAPEDVAAVVEAITAQIHRLAGIGGGSVGTEAFSSLMRSGENTIGVIGRLESALAQYRAIEATPGHVADSPLRDNLAREAREADLLLHKMEQIRAEASRPVIQKIVQEVVPAPLGTYRANEPQPQTVVRGLDTSATEGRRIANEVAAQEQAQADILNTQQRAATEARRVEAQAAAFRGSQNVPTPVPPEAPLPSAWDDQQTQHGRVESPSQSMARRRREIDQDLIGLNHERLNQVYADSQAGRQGWARENGPELLDGLSPAQKYRMLSGQGVPANQLARRLSEESTMAMFDMMPAELREKGKTRYTIPGTVDRDTYIADRLDGGSGLGDVDEARRRGISTPRDEREARESERTARLARESRRHTLSPPEFTQAPTRLSEAATALQEGGVEGLKAFEAQAKAAAAAEGRVAKASEATAVTGQERARAALDQGAARSGRGGYLASLTDADAAARAARAISDPRTAAGYEFTPAGEGRSLHRLSALAEDGKSAGEMLWHKTTGEIASLNVELEHQRKGIATGLWAQANEVAANTSGVLSPQHSSERTAAGDAWARTVGGQLPAITADPEHPDETARITEKVRRNAAVMEARRLAEMADPAVPQQSLRGPVSATGALSASGYDLGPVEAAQARMKAASAHLDSTLGLGGAGPKMDWEDPARVAKADEAQRALDRATLEHAEEQKRFAASTASSRQKTESAQAAVAHEAEILALEENHAANAAGNLAKRQEYLTGLYHDSIAQGAKHADLAKSGMFDPILPPGGGRPPGNGGGGGGGGGDDDDGLNDRLNNSHSIYGEGDPVQKAQARRILAENQMTEALRKAADGEEGAQTAWLRATAALNGALINEAKAIADRTVRNEIASGTGRIDPNASGRVQSAQIKAALAEEEHKLLVDAQRQHAAAGRTVTLDFEITEAKAKMLVAQESLAAATLAQTRAARRAAVDAAFNPSAVGVLADPQLKQAQANAEVARNTAQVASQTGELAGSLKERTLANVKASVATAREVALIEKNQATAAGVTPLSPPKKVIAAAVEDADMMSRVDKTASTQIQLLQVERAHLVAAEERLAATNTGLGHEVRLARATLAVARIEERISATKEREAAAAAKEASGGSGSGGGLGIGSSLKYFAFYQVFSLAQRGLEELMRTTEQYSLAVNQLAISMGMSYKEAIPLAERYSTAGSHLATQPSVAINAATEYGRVFEDKSITTGDIGAKLGSTIQLLEARTARDGEEEKLVAKRQNEIAAISLNYDMGPAAGADLYGSATYIAQQYGVSQAGGALLGGGAQISDLLKQSGFSSSEGLSAIAAIMQRTSDTSEAAGSDLKRVIGRSGTNPFNAMMAQYGIDQRQSFKDQMLDLSVKYKAMPEGGNEQSGIIAKLGGNRVGNVALALLQNIDEIDARAKKADEHPNAANDQAQKELATFAGAMKTIGADVKNLAQEISKSGLGETIGGVMGAIHPLIEGLQVLTKGLNFLPGAISGPVLAIAVLTAAMKAMGGVAGTTSVLNQIGDGTLLKGAKKNLPLSEAGLQRVLAGEVEASTPAAGPSLLERFRKSRTAPEVLPGTAALNTARDANYAAMTAQGAASEQVHAAEEAKRDASAAARGKKTAAQEAELAATTARLTAAQARLAEANTLVAKTSTAVMQAKDREAAANVRLATTEGEVTTAGTSAAVAQQRLAVAQLEGSVAGTAAITGTRLAGVGAGLAGLAGAAVSAAAALAPLALIIGGFILAGKIKEAGDKANEGRQESNVAYAQAEVGNETGRPQEIKGAIAKLEAANKKLRESNWADNWWAKGPLASISPTIPNSEHSPGNTNPLKDPTITTGPSAGARSPMTVHQGLVYNNAEIARYREEQKFAEDRLIGADGSTAGSVYFGSDWGGVDSGIRNLGGARLGSKDSSRLMQELLGHISTGENLGKAISPEAGAKGIPDEIKRLVTQAQHGRSPGGEEATLRDLLPLAAKVQASVNSIDPEQAEAGQAIIDQINKPYYDMVVKNANSKIASIKAFEGESAKSHAKIRAILTSSLMTTASGGDIEGTIAMINVMSVKELNTFNAMVEGEKAILRAKMASLQALLAAAEADVNALIEAEPDDRRQAILSKREIDGTATPEQKAAEAKLKAAKAQLDKLDEASATIAAAKPYSAPSGSASKFDGAKDKGPTAAQIEEARLASNIIPSDPLSAATWNLKIAQYKMRNPKDQVEYYTALKNLHEQQYAYAMAVMTASNDAIQLKIDLTDPVKVAEEKLAEAKRQLAFDKSRPGVGPSGALADVVNKDALAVKQAKSAAEAAHFNQEFSDHQTNYNLQRESLGAYLSYLNAQHQYLTAIKVKSRQQIDELNQVDQALKGLADSMQGQFNLGEIKMPSPYEVRRIQAGGGASVSNVQITINGADITAVKGILSQYVGQGVMATAGTATRKV